MSKGWHSQVGRPQPGPHETLPALQDFYQEVANPLMTSVAFEDPSNAVESVTQDTFRVFFKGSELVVAGKLREQSPDVLLAQIRGQLVSVAGHSGGEGQLGRAVRGAGLKPQPCQAPAH